MFKKLYCIFLVIISLVLSSCNTAGSFDEFTTSSYGEIHHIAEELADCLVMLKQFQLYYCIKDEEIEEIMKFKINRQIGRIEKEW